MPVPHRPTESARQSHCREPDALVDFHTAGDVAGDWPRTAPSAARADNAALRPGAVRADVVAGGVRSASAVVIGAGGGVRSRSNSASRPSTRDFFRSATSAAISSRRLVSAWMASSSSSFVADSRRRRRVQPLVAGECWRCTRRGAKQSTACSRANVSVALAPLIVRIVAFDGYACSGWLAKCRCCWGIAHSGLKSHLSTGIDEIVASRLVRSNS